MLCLTFPIRIHLVSLMNTLRILATIHYLNCFHGASSRYYLLMKGSRDNFSPLKQYLEVVQLNLSVNFLKVLMRFSQRPSTLLPPFGRRSVNGRKNSIASSDPDRKQLYGEPVLGA